MEFWFPSKYVIAIHVRGRYYSLDVPSSLHPPSSLATKLSTHHHWVTRRCHSSLYVDSSSGWRDNLPSGANTVVLIHFVSPYQLWGHGFFGVRLHLRPGGPVEDRPLHPPPSLETSPTWNRLLLFQFNTKLSPVQVGPVIWWNQCVQQPNMMGSVNNKGLIGFPVYNNSFSSYISHKTSLVWSVIKFLYCKTSIDDVDSHTPYFDMFVWRSCYMP